MAITLTRYRERGRPPGRQMRNSMPNRPGICDLSSMSLVPAFLRTRFDTSFARGRMVPGSLSQRGWWLLCREAITFSNYRLTCTAHSDSIDDRRRFSGRTLRTAVFRNRCRDEFALVQRYFSFPFEQASK